MIKKIYPYRSGVVFVLAVFLFVLCLYPGVAHAFPADARYECTFDSMRFSEDGVDYGSNILSEPLTIDFFNNDVRTASGTEASISNLSTGEVIAYVNMSITSITLSATGETTRDVKAEMEEAMPEDFGNMTMEVIPFTYTGGELQLNMYVAKPGDGVEFSEWNVANSEPSFSFQGAGVLQSAVGTVNLDVIDVDNGTYLFAQAYRSRDEGSGPSFVNPFLDPAADNAVSGSIVVPTGTFFIAASASNGPATAEGVEFGETEWTFNGVNRSFSMITVEAGETYTRTLSREANVGPQEGEEESEYATLVLAAASGSSISLGMDGAGITVFGPTSEASIRGGGEPLGMSSYEATSFSTAVSTFEYITPGSYYIQYFLDVNNNQSMDDGVDYWGAYGGWEEPTIVTLEADQIANISSNPISLEVVTEGP